MTEQLKPRKAPDHWRKTGLPEEIKETIFDDIKTNTIENHEGCWIWQGPEMFGYGRKKIDGKNWKVHRLMYIALHGDIPEGLLIRHLCGNRRCCNPIHLKLGTHKDNANDSIIHGTSRFHNINQNGANNHIAKLTEEIVYDMRRKYASKEANFTQLAEQYNVDRKAAERAVRGHTYQEFNDIPPIPFTKKEKS